MSLAYNHFGRMAVFDDEQEVVVRQLSDGYVKLFGKNILLEIENDELRQQLADKDAEFKELQQFIDRSIADLDSD